MGGAVSPDQGTDFSNNWLVARGPRPTMNGFVRPIPQQKTKIFGKKKSARSLDTHISDEKSGHPYF
jgi:hypothetical protein